MPVFPFVTLDVFTDHPFDGNPLAVFTDARGLSDAQMQSLVAEMNLSETTFVLPPEDAAHTAGCGSLIELPRCPSPDTPASERVSSSRPRRAMPQVP